MAQTNSNAHNFDFGKIDWETYESHRPPYPDALYDVIFQHHQDHGGDWDLALDVGAGGGTVTKVLLHHFDHVVCSDAAAGYVAQAEHRFSQERSTGSMSFLHRKFHEFSPETDFPSGRLVDMVTAGTCIHTLWRSIQSYNRAGTPVPILPPNDPAKHRIALTKDKILCWFHENVTKLDQIDATGTGQARYNNLNFDPSLWTYVRRITSLADEYVWPEWIKASESRVRTDLEQMEIVQDDFITKTVDYDFFPAYFNNLAPGYDISDLIEDDLKKIKEALGHRKVVA
ncbi:hypothetical protein FSST1_012917 [Fusarium sambucinum]